MSKNKLKTMLKNLLALKNQKDFTFKKEINDVISKQPIIYFETFLQDSSLRIYSRGGSEFIVPMLFHVEEVYPIENGIIAKVRYDRDKLFFEPTHIKKDNNDNGSLFGRQTPKEWTYMTITDHPLDDIHPLGYQDSARHSGIANLIQTQLEILHVSYKLPVIVFYNPLSQHVIVGLIKNKDENIDQMQQQNEDPIDESQAYIKRIEPESRHPEIFNMSKDSKIVIEEIFSVAVGCAPSKIMITRGLTNQYELNIGMFSLNSRRYEVYQCDVRQLRAFRKVLDLGQVQDAIALRFLHQCQDPVDIISSGRGFNIMHQDAAFSVSVDLKIFKKRLQSFDKETLILDAAGRQIHVYQGCSHVLTLDLLPLLDTFLIDKTSLSRASKIEALENVHGSNLTLNLNNGVNKRITLKLWINDFLVTSIMKIFRVILPAKLYESFNQDLIETFMKCSIEAHNQSKHSILNADQITKFTAFLLAILTGNHSQFSFMVKNALPIQNNISSQQMTPQSSSNSKNTTPTQSLQTKILRSSTTSFGPDAGVNRRKTTYQAVATASQPSSYSQIAQHQQQSMLKAQVLGRQSSSGTQVPSTQPTRKFITPVSQGSDNQLSSFSSTVNNAQVVKELSSNPFADLLNSDFHKENFHSQYASLFPADMQLFAPVQPIIVQQEQQQTLMASPTKSTTSSKMSTTSTVAQPRLTQTKSASATYNQPERKPQTLVPPQSVSPTHTQQQVIPPTTQTNVQVPFTTLKHELLMHFNSIFNILHLFYEDLKLNKLRDSVESPKLAKLLMKLAIHIDHQRKAAYIGYYIKQHKDTLAREEYELDIKLAFKNGSVFKEGVDIESVPRLYKWLEEALNGEHGKSVFSQPLPLFFENTRKVARLYEILNNSLQGSHIHQALLVNHTAPQIDYTALDFLVFNKKGISQFDFVDYRDYLKQDKPLVEGFQNLHLFEKILFTLKEENLGLEELKRLPSIVSLPLLEIIRYSRLFQQEIQTVPQWPDSLYKLIQREDILNNLRLFERGGLPQMQSMSSPDLLNQASKKLSLNRQMTNVFQGTSIEEIQQEEHRRQMESNIMKTAADFINAQSGLTKSSQEAGEKNNKIMDFLKNRFSSDTRYKEVMNFLNSSNEIVIKLEHIPNRESLTEEQMNSEKQKLLDKMFLRQLSKCVGRGALTFGSVQTLPTETLKVPKINPTGFVPVTESYMQVEFKDDQSKDILQWPEFHNGVASAMKIALSFNKNRRTASDINQVQHTRNWIMYHKPQEPKYEHGGFCLAMGLLGQFDTLQPTDIYQHLKSTHDATTIGILLGRAASKIGTMDDHDTRTLCIHIPYLLPPTLSLEVSLSVQSAAVIGAGLLYKGTSNRLMTEMLLAQIGRKPLSDKAIEREGYALASGIALGLVNLGIGNKMQGLIDLKLDERLIRYVEGGKIIDLPQSMVSQNFNHDNTKCSSIKEGDMVNVHITSQGAIIALALIHLKSNNKSIADSLLMPQTFYSLESVRPSFLLLKVLCKNLILWDEIECSESWVSSQIPMIIHDIYTNDINKVELMYQQKFIEDGIDYSTVALCYVNIVAGAVFSLGFKYAGTGNKEAFRLVQEYCQFFKKIKTIQSNKDSIGMIHTNATKNQIDKNTVETCLCVSAFAMSMIMAGTGDVECFRTLRVLRKRFEHDMHYGYNMAINMSLGFLFLGSGAFTFSRSDLAIASLLCSLYPVFPTNPSDNRYHLQALRHFYVLAIESRLIQARDIDNGEFLNIEMKVEVIEEDDQLQIVTDDKLKVITITTPDIINGKIKTIAIANEKYHNVNLKFTSNGLEVDDQTGNNSGKIQDKKQKFFEQFDFQKIVYVKKKNSSQVNTAKQTSNFIVKDKVPVIDENISSNLEKIDFNSKSLVEDSNQLYESILQIKDKTIEALCKHFSQLNNSQSFTNIEDVLLAQSKDNQLSPAEFFKIQDLYDQIKECMLQNHIPQSLKYKLSLMKEIYQLYNSDKLEFIGLMLDIILTRLNQKSFKYMNTFRMLKAYSNFKFNKEVYTSFKEQNGDRSNFSLNMILSGTERQCLPDLRTKHSLVKVLSNFHHIAQPQVNDLFNFGIDLHELQVAKTVIDTILEDLRTKGPAEADIVKRYKFQKINELLMNGPAELELNEVLVTTLQHLVTDRITTGSQTSFVNDILLPALIQVEI